MVSNGRGGRRVHRRRNHLCRLLMRAPQQTRQEVLENLKATFLSRKVVNVEIQQRPTHVNPPYVPAIAAGVMYTVLSNMERLVVW